MNPFEAWSNGDEAAQERIGYEEGKEATWVPDGIGPDEYGNYPKDMTPWQRGFAQGWRESGKN